MYKELQTNPIINDIWCVPFGNLRLIVSTNEKVLQVFEQGLPDNSYIVYTDSDDSIVVLGYYVLDNNNMSKSIYYESLRNVTQELQNIDPTDEINQIDCVHIREWVFDNSLKKENYLNRIFNIMISTYLDGNKHIMWFVNKNQQLSFYPIFGNWAFLNIAAIKYLTDAFLNE